MKDRKRHVVLTAKRLFIQKGFADTSVQDIIEESNISKGTFYNYFSSKNDCIKAILQLAKDEESLRRQELIVGEDRTNKDTFTKQILVSFQINQEYHLLPILETVFHSSDLELSQFVNELYIKELTWIKQRFIDIYGIEARPYAADCAIIFYGILKQMIHTWKSCKMENVNHAQLIEFTLNRIDATIKDLITSNERLFKEPLLLKTNLEMNQTRSAPTKKEIIQQLSQLTITIKHEKLLFSVTEEYIRFLLDELNEEFPRITIIKTVLPPFRKAFDQTPYEKTVQDLSIAIWQLIDN